MRILLLHSSSDIYGASKIFLQTVQLLKNKGHHPVVALSNHGALATELEKIGVDTHIINLAIIRRKYFNLSGILNRYKKWKLALRALDYIIETHNIDTIYSNTAAVLVGGYIAKRKGLTHIWHLHEIIEKPLFLHKILAWCLRNWSDKIIVVSKAVESHWQDAKPNSKSILTNTKPAMFQIYNGIEPIAKSIQPTYRTQLNIPNNALVIGMAARIHFWKGQSYFVDIARALLQSNNTSPLYFIIAGDPFPGYEHLQAALEKSIQQHGLEARIFYIGLVKEMDLFYRSIDVLILPSQLPDPLPTVVLEAMQYGKSVIATAQGGALEMIIGEDEKNESESSEQTGIFIPINNVEAAKKLIVPILKSEKLQSLGAAGKKRVDTYFSAAAFEKNILEVFELN